MSNIKRNIHGVLLLDKPRGITSNGALQKAKRLFSARKAGHSGSLDPIATGLLPIPFGEATKFSRFLLKSDKVYQVIAKLGVRTDTGDSEGQVIQERSVPDLSRDSLETLFQRFSGNITQIPSMFSAIKQMGQPLYKLARLGIEVERAERKITVYSLRLMHFEKSEFTFEAKVSKGTYIRTLVDDMGELLGCGAHVTLLRRIGAGPYHAEQMVNFETLEAIVEQGGPNDLDKFLVPVHTSIQWPEVILSEPAAYYLRKGQPVIVPYAPTQGFVKILQKNHDFLGIGEILEDGRVAPRRLISENFKEN